MRTLQLRSWSCELMCYQPRTGAYFPAEDADPGESTHAAETGKRLHIMNTPSNPR